MTKPFPYLYVNVNSDSNPYKDLDSPFFVAWKRFEEDRPSTSKRREYKCSCCKVKNDHYKPKCPHKNNCPSNERKDELIYTSREECFFGIVAKKFVKRGEKIPSNCHCAQKGDEQCHGIADMLGGPGICENCFSCSREMNIKMRKMENFVKKSDGGSYIVSCDDSKYAKTILQIFESYNGVATTTVITRESPTNLHYDL
ncbi:hypothetical protein RCL_jg13109.t1 [Rhizophagus clarus]|uniref:Uncharacterized protein n=1 Tax=Rhizophagus clarus TaxID=94130 RepID=A0A8H3KWF4_9GLOM|nr:hypothetical protein RCL_jg13109.t1 [Rhizophagus clarus]